MSKQNQHKPNVPELRFPEFSGEWEERKLEDVYQVKMGQSPASINYTDNNEDTVLVQGNADLKGGKISPRIFTKEVTKVADKNDILLTVRAPVGKLAIAQYKVCIGRGVCSINGNRFLYNYLQKFQNQSKWMKFSQGSTFEAISGKDIRNILVAIPNKDEQQKIGDFFSKLDRLIELEEKKLALLEEQKKGYMKKIFSQELRFKDENGDEYPEWITKKLGDIGKVAMNKRIFKNETTSYGEIPFYKIGTFGKVADSFITRQKFEEYKNKYPYPEIGDILISASGSIGRTIEYKGEEAYFQDSNIVWLKHNDEVIKSYLKQYYNIIKWKGIEGTTIKRLYNKNILESKIIIPAIEEQKKIANFLNDMDVLIHLKKSRLDLLLKNKEALLNKILI